MSTRWRVVDLTGYSGELRPGIGRLSAGGQEFPLVAWDVSYWALKRDGLGN